jgi:hypothetical protein
MSNYDLTLEQQEQALDAETKRRSHALRERIREQRAVGGRSQR